MVIIGLKYAPLIYAILFLTHIKKNKEQEVVILSCVLAVEMNMGYHDFAEAILVKCNDIEIHNIAQLAKICDQCTEQQQQFIKFEIRFDVNTRICVLDTMLAKQQIGSILNEYQITHDRSLILQYYQKSGYPEFDFEKKLQNNNNNDIKTTTENSTKNNDNTNSNTDNSNNNK